MIEISLKFASCKNSNFIAKEEKKQIIIDGHI